MFESFGGKVSRKLYLKRKEKQVIKATSALDSAERPAMSVEFDAVTLIQLGSRVVSAEPTQVVLRPIDVNHNLFDVIITGAEDEMAELVRFAGLSLAAHELTRANEELGLY